MELLIRNAIKEDMSSVLKLIVELAVFEKEPDAVEISEEDLIVAGFGDDKQFDCFVAEADGEIVGMALVYFRFSTWKGRTVHLEDLVVKEKMRGKGVGKALYRRVMEYAAEQGVKRVNWVVLDWNKPAIDFYEQTGATILSSWWQVEMEELALKKFIEQKE
ncbi:MAG: GNAT family N-acetyltransferase [Bacteroidia bacterium]|nr:GNAT family N-acetyltransferase [Bacteroidia bacterium]NNF30695.1 GNAT family N-acetyltransferase [Flavobacteriaceae bacterium]MBT8277260.1 GNAT family N-acetyltransferase [Bacteroidia bacterium]NNJ80785.1 GNAT family N-acetyltransferase [Flavobacteriaceae bacterium]NNK54860.1 GNAT family N-acetyltransferase [Flavobacteriaceae bacterium]